MPKLFYCPRFVQSMEKGASVSNRNACKYCGKTKEAHQLILPPDNEADEWLIAHGLKDKPYFELIRNVLTQYIKEVR